MATRRHEETNRLAWACPRDGARDCRASGGLRSTACTAGPLVVTGRPTPDASTTRARWGTPNPASSFGLRASALALCALACTSPPREASLPAQATPREPGTPTADEPPAPAESPALRPNADLGQGVDELARLDARRRELVELLALEPGWNLYQARRHFIATPVDDPWLVEGLRRRLAATSALLEGWFGAESDPPAAPALVRVYPTRAAYLAAGAPTGSSGVWLSPERTLALFDGRDAVGRASTTWGALQHMLVHEFLDRRAGLEAVPPWLLFGLGGYCEALVLSDGGALLPPLDGGRWTHLREVTAAEGPPPLARLLAFERDEFLGQNEFGSGAWRNLVLASALVGYLREELSAGQPGAGLLTQAVHALARGESPAPPPAAELAALEASWRRWIAARTGRSL